MARLREDVSAAHEQWQILPLYEKFEHIVVLLLTALITAVIVAAVWSLTLKILTGIILAENFDPTDQAVYQTIFGMIFTVVIALEFKRSLLVVTERRETIVHVRAVILIAILAIVRKFIILDVSKTGAMELFALAAAILALGLVYWLVRDQDRRERGLVASAQDARPQRKRPRRPQTIETP